MGAAGFMIIKYIEYSHKFHVGFLPGMAFYEEPNASHLWLPLEEQHDQEMARIRLELDAANTVFAKETATRGAMPAPPVTAEPSVVKPSGTGPGGLTTNEFDQDRAEFSVFLPPSVIETLEDQKPELEFAEHHTPGEEPHLPHPLQDPNRPPNAQKFFTIYFLMTGLHGIHVILGGFLILWLLFLTLRGRFHAGYYTPIDLGGLYWHIVDVIWIFLFPLFYLI